MRRWMKPACILAVLLFAGCSGKSADGGQPMVEPAAREEAVGPSADETAHPAEPSGGNTMEETVSEPAEPDESAEPVEAGVWDGIASIRDVSPLGLFGNDFFAGAGEEELTGLGIPLGITYGELRAHYGEPAERDSWGGGAYAKYFGSVFFIDPFDYADSGKPEFADHGTVHIGWYKMPDGLRLRDFYTVLGQPSGVDRNGEDGEYDETWNFSYGVFEKGGAKFELNLTADGTNRNSRVAMMELRIPQEEWNGDTVPEEYEEHEPDEQTWKGTVTP